MSLDRSTLFIDGEWAAPASSDTIQVVSPHSEQVIATVPEGTTADIDAAVAAARRAFDSGPWPRMSPEERIEVVQNFSNLYAGKLGEMAELITAEMGSPTSFANLAQAPAPWMQIEAFLGIARDVPVGGAAHRHARHRRHRTARAGRRGRGDPAVERPAVHDHVQGDPGAAVRLHRRGEAGAGDPARHVPDGRAAPRGRRARRRREHRGRRA